MSSLRDIPRPIELRRRRFERVVYWRKIVVFATSSSFIGWSANAHAWGDVVTGMVITGWLAWLFRPDTLR